MKSCFKKEQFLGKTPRQIRDDLECGVQEASDIFDVCGLLHDLDKSETLREVKSILSRFITMKTGIE